MIIRLEGVNDVDPIHELTRRAFEPMPFSNGSEAPIIRQLRRDGDLTLSLVAELKNVIVGHIAFSPVTFKEDDGNWFGLGPVSVEPDLQRGGIGSRLIKEGLSRISDFGATGCVLVGNPGYYQRFGFQSDGSVSYNDTPRMYVQWLSFGTEKPTGEIKYAPAFDR